jgi:class 3 adenylate cyclase
VTATFVFTDLVDSTAIAARLGPAAAEELRLTHFGLLRTAVAAAGGTEVKNLGDGLMVVFSSPSRAVSCAVGMQQAVDAHNARSPVPLSIRVGLATGEQIQGFTEAEAAKSDDKDAGKGKALNLDKFAEEWLKSNDVEETDGYFLSTPAPVPLCKSK